MANAPTTYRHHRFAQLRASTDPGGLELPESLGVDDPAMPTETTRWISELWQRDEVRTAITHASPALAAQLEHLAADPDTAPDQVRRVAVSLASYLLRWTGRATPFGMFAGTAFIRTARTPTATWSGKHTPVVRADASWLSRIISGLEEDPAVLEHLPVATHSAVSVRGPRCVIPGPPVEHPDLNRAPLEISTRFSGPVRTALEAASDIQTYGVVREQIASRFPAAPRERVDGLLRELVAAGFLITALRAPTTASDPLEHAASVLAQAKVSGPAAIDAAREAAGPDCYSAPALMIDTALDCEVALPVSVLDEAAEAAGLLCRLSPHPVGYPAWRDYHRRFRATYGPGALVPLLELVSDGGLGYPAGYLGSAHERAPRQLSARDEMLLELVQRAQADQHAEIELTPSVIAEIEAAGTVAYAPRAEICVEIRSPSLHALGRGRFQLAITGTPRPGSGMAGRFAHLLDADERAALASTYGAHGEGALAAQLSFPPRKRSNENLTRCPELLSHTISIGEHRDRRGNVFVPSELAVTADARSLYLVHAPTGRLVEPRVTHALEAGVQTPPLARFVAEVATARCAVYKAFDFGTAARLPYLPRVRYRRTVLAPARWLLGSRDLPGRSASTHDWDEALRQWRTRWRVPDHVALIEDDRRLPIDLTHRFHRFLLRTRLSARGRIELREAARPEQLGWIGRAHEVLIPLTLALPPRPAPTALVLRADSQLPGDAGVLHARIYAHPARFDELLTDHLSRLADRLPGLERWWFLRHRAMTRPEDAQYLSVLVRLADPSAYGEAAADMNQFARDLRRVGLCADLALVTYHPQPGRYGYGPAMEAAHEVFAADTDAAIAQLRACREEGVHRQALAAASMLSIALGLTDSVEQAHSWLLENLPRSGDRLLEPLRKQAFLLVEPDEGRNALAALPGGEQIAAAWSERTEALRRYREVLISQRDPTTVVRSLLHQHHVRAVRVDPQTERVTERLARAAALSWTRRQEQRK